MAQKTTDVETGDTIVFEDQHGNNVAGEVELTHHSQIRLVSKHGVGATTISADEIKYVNPPTYFCTNCEETLEKTVPVNCSPSKTGETGCAECYEATIAYVEESLAYAPNGCDTVSLDELEL